MLSYREKEILDLLSKGLLYKEIASQLGIKIPTVKIRNCYQSRYEFKRFGDSLRARVTP